MKALVGAVYEAKALVGAYSEYFVYCVCILMSLIEELALHVCNVPALTLSLLREICCRVGRVVVFLTVPQVAPARAPCCPRPHSPAVSRPGTSRSHSAAACGR